MISNESIFIHKQTFNNTITMINGDILKSHEINEIKINLKNLLITITNVSYVFDFDANLLSISVLNKKDFSSMFQKKKLKCEKKNILIVTKIVKEKCIFYVRSKRNFESSKKKIKKIRF